MNENMNRFDYNTEGKICDYGYEEPKVLTKREILAELNHLENTKNEFLSECENLNWQVEYLQDQCDKKDTKIAEMQIKIKTQPKQIIKRIIDQAEFGISFATEYNEKRFLDFLDNLLKEYGNE